MSLNIHIVTLGTDPETGKLDLTRISELFNKGFPTVDRIHVIQPAEQKLKEENVFGIPVFFHYIQDMFDFLITMEQVITIYKNTDEKEAEFSVNITGGTKPMSVGAFIGATYIGARTYYLPKDARSFIEITPPRIPPGKLTELQGKIIKVIDKKRQIDLKAHHADRGMSQTELGKELVTSGQTMNYNCLKLEEVGYIKIKQDEKDGRKKICTLTDQGIVASRLI